MIDIVEVIRTFISELDLSGVVVSLSNDGTNTTLVLENSYHLREYMTVTIDWVNATFTAEGFGTVSY